MIKFDEYEDVNARIKRFRAANQFGRIETDIVECDLDKGYILVRARIYREHEDLVPAAVDYAFGHQGFYRENMKRWYVEDTTTSAIGRAISLLMPVESRATKQNMDEVENAPIVDVWATITPAPEPGVIAIGSAVEALKSQPSATDRIEVLVTAAELQSIPPEKITTMRFTLQESDRSWAQIETDKGETRDKLVPS